MGKMTICVYGAASNKIDSVFITETEEARRRNCPSSSQIIYGGGASGVMGACARGAAREGGTVIGVVPILWMNSRSSIITVLKLSGQKP